MPGKVGRPAIGPKVDIALPQTHHELVTRLARRRRLDASRQGVRTRMLRYVLDAGFEALRARGEL